MGSVRIGKMVLGDFQTNCYFVYNETDGEGAIPVIVVDPAEEGKRIFEVLLQKGFRVEAILLTHGHVDHIHGAMELRSLSGAGIYAGEQERELLSDMGLNLSERFGMPCRIVPDQLLRDGETYTLADITFRAFHTPGHTEGGYSYYFEEGGFVLSGDTLFEGSVGRTDFPTGSMSVLVHSIKEKLFALPEKTVVYPGHGGSTTIGWEKENNPFTM